MKFAKGQKIQTNIQGEILTVMTQNGNIIETYEGKAVHVSHAIAA